jgi:hypothetical protein
MSADNAKATILSAKGFPCFTAMKQQQPAESNTLAITPICGLLKIKNTALIKDNGVIIAKRIRIVVFSSLFLQIRSRTTINTDSTAIAIAKAETLISSKLYPKHAVIITPAGYSIVSTNNKGIKIDIAFFI